MAKDKSIPDSIAPHLSQIAERLWGGRAAVMVGAGFSKNASREYPDWKQLGDKLYEKAHGKPPSVEDKSYVSLLKIAEEAEAVIGRPALDAVLQSDIPDLGVEPSKLHISLLELPWVDILTTNYDTLLERARRKVIAHRYSCVVNQNDLPNAQKPRIIKLHGSFPAHTPFVITEEDYRRYPQSRASFVNSVRQILLENTLVLIGFSGDDPNFLHWIGWVRDQMGEEYAQPIYLISAGSFPVAQQQLLAKRNIIIVDMAQCENVKRDNHDKALAQFFRELEGKKPTQLDWPKPKDKESKTLSGPSGRKILIADMESALESWRKERLSYPGWVVPPHSSRSNLYARTRTWFSTQFESEMDNLRNGVDILYCGELVWRIDKCLLPLSDDVAGFCARTLKKYCNFYEELDSAISFKLCNSKNHAWVLIAISLLRYYREQDKHEDWCELRSQLELKKQYFSDGQFEQLHYEVYLFSLFQLDVVRARECLINWKPKASQLFWQSIRLSAMAELGQFDNLSAQVKDALFETRIAAQMEKNLDSVLYLSQEACQMVSSKWVVDSLAERGLDPTQEEMVLMESYFKENWKTELSEGNENVQKNKIGDRQQFQNADEDWENLSQEKDGARRREWLDIIGIIRDRERSDEEKLSDIRREALKRKKCDPLGELTLLTSSSSSYIWHDQEKSNAYSVLRFFEDVGFPFRVRNTLFFSKMILGNLQYIVGGSVTWARTTFLRVGGDSNAIEYVFSRESIIKLSGATCDALVIRYLSVLENFHISLKAGDYFEHGCIEMRLARVLPEVVSRLCCKCTFQVKERILALISELYASESKDNFSNINKLVHGLVASLSESEQFSLFPKLLNVSFPNSLNPRTEMDYISLTQWLTIGNKKELIRPNIDIAAGVIDGLLCDLASSVKGKVSWAITSLVKLYNLSLLDESQRQQFSSALWDRVDGSGFPEETDFYNFVFLTLPVNEGCDIRYSFKSYIDSCSFPVRGDSRGYTVTQGHIPLVDEIVGASQYDGKMWTHQEALKLLNKISLWWNTDKKWLEHERNQSDQNESFFGDNKEFYKRLSQISAVIVAIGPSLNSRLAKKEKTKLFDLLGDMHSQGIGTLEARAACIHVMPELRETLIGFIADALLGNNKTIQIDAHKAIRCIALNRKLIDLWSESYDLLIQFIQWNRSASLAEGMGIARRILNENDEFFPVSFKPTIGKRLIQLVQESDYENGTLDINVREKINLRRVAASLAKQIDKVYEHKDDVLNKAINDWRKIGESDDEFAEVRNAWVD
jgi:hypothetical protein